MSCVARNFNTSTRLRRSVSDGSFASAASKLASASASRSSSSSRLSLADQRRDIAGVPLQRAIEPGRGVLLVAARHERGRPSPSPRGETTAAVSTRPRIRVRRCAGHRAAGTASRDRSARPAPGWSLRARPGTQNQGVSERRPRPAAPSARIQPDHETRKHRNTERQVVRAPSFTARRPPRLRDVRRCESDHRQQAARHVGLDRRALAHRRVAMHGRMAIEPREAFGVNRIREVEIDRDPLLIEREPRSHAVEQLVDARAGVRGNEEGGGIGVLDAAPLVGGNRVDLVVDLDAAAPRSRRPLRARASPRPRDARVRDSMRRSHAARGRRRRSLRAWRETRPPACGAGDR